MKIWRSIALTVAIVVATFPGFADAASSPRLSRVSGPSPYGACAVSDPNDTLFPNAEVEPDVASNPARRGNLIAVWQQDRWALGGARGLMAGYTYNGGRTWGRSTLPFDSCAPDGLPYQRASDPAVSIGPDGTAYAIGLSFDSPGPRTAIASAVSRDGGRTWKTLRVIATDNNFGLDKEWITADPKKPGTAYAVWDNLHVTGDGHFTGPAYFSKTTDFGRTWSEPKAIAAKGQDQQTLGNQILVDARTGRLYDTYAYYFCTCTAIPKIAYVYSDDGGRNWSRQRVVSDLLTVGVVQPGTNFPVRSGGFPLAAISRTGQVFVTWQDSRFSGGSYDEIAMAVTRDRGAHWTKPHRVNKPTGRAAFTPSVAVSDAGDVAVTYYDLRNDKLHDTLFSTNYWATATRDGKHFSGDRHIAGGFDLVAAPNAFGLFVGDYEGLAASGGTFVSVFVKTNCNGTNCADNSTDVYSARFSGQIGGKTATGATASQAPLPRSRVATPRQPHPIR